MAVETPRTHELSADQFTKAAKSIEEEVSKVIVGQKETLRGVLISLLAGGHCLLEGVPGLGKTMLVRTLGAVLDLNFSRIQFTPDLMPADIIGTNVIVEDPDGGRGFRFQPGPIFANLILADEINRATPKTQSALLEAMAEGTVTVANMHHRLSQPFFVLATQNPIEMEGTYPLPEAQMDRFLFKLKVEFPNASELTEVVNRTTIRNSPAVTKVTNGQQVNRMIGFARDVPIAQHVVDYAVRLVIATHPDNEGTPKVVNDYVRYGASPRGAQAIVLAGKIRALLEGRYNVAFEDIRAVAPMALRHRLILNFEGLAEGIDTDAVIADLLKKVPEEVKGR